MDASDPKITINVSGHVDPDAIAVQVAEALVGALREQQARGRKEREDCAKGTDDFEVRERAIATVNDELQKRARHNAELAERYAMEAAKARDENRGLGEDNAQLRDLLAKVRAVASSGDGTQPPTWASGGSPLTRPYVGTYISPRNGEERT